MYMSPQFNEMCCSLWETESLTDYYYDNYYYDNYATPHSEEINYEDRKQEMHFGNRISGHRRSLKIFFLWAIKHVTSAHSYEMLIPN